MDKRLSPKQQEIIRVLRDLGGKATKQELYDNCTTNYYANGKFHFGNILTRLVQRGILQRPKKGTYQFKPQIDKQTLKLFGNNKKVQK